MKVLVLDDGQKRSIQMREELERKSIETIVHSTSNGFMEALGISDFDRIFINVDTWEKGRAIYDYFGIGKKLERKQIIFFNADESFSSINDRASNEKDQVLYKPTDIDSLIGAM